MLSANETIFEVNLKKLEQNYHYLKDKLNKDCEIIAVVKAFAYGHGDIPVCKKLEKLGVHAFWVADFEEGVTLRRSGIKTKIIIANPGRKSFKYIVENNLDVVIHNHHLLDYYISNQKNVNIHIKLNTGMNRYGFDPHEVDLVCEKLKKNKHLNIVSLCSHLSSSDDATKRKVSENQISLFESLCSKIEELLNKNIDMHILNSNGLLYFKKKQFNFVRLGISLFGSHIDNNLQQVSKLKSVISQNRNIKKGEGVGYSSDFISNKEMNISTIPIGYADGLNRKIGNGVGKILVNKILCPIIGKICMDSLMIDTSNIKCKVGDIVEIFGEQNSILTLANDLGTNPYEIYSTINRRIKRIYIDN